MEEVVYWDKATECLPREQIEQNQLAKLRDKMAYVIAKSSFYKRKFEAAKIAPEQILKMEDLQRIPLTTKEELQQSQAENPPWGDFACITSDDAVRVFQTSGTTGKPVKFMFSRTDWHDVFYEQFMHYRCGYGLTEKDVLFVPFNYGLYIAWWGFQTAMERAGLMIIPGGGLSTKDRVKAMLDWGATVVCGTPSYMLFLSETAAGMGVDLAGSSIRKIVVAGEPGANVPATKKALEGLWGAECFDNIGATEINNFGHECIKHQGTHMIESLFLPEVLDTETHKPLPDDEIGEMVLTNLSCESTPLIRYRLKDLVKFNREPCECGRTHLRLMGGVLGRADDMFHHAGTNIYPSQIQNLLHHEDAFSLEFQLVVPPQGSGRHLKIRVEPAAEDLSADQLETSRAHLIEAVKYAVHVTPDVEVVEINSLPRFEGKGKRLIREDK